MDDSHQSNQALRRITAAFQGNRKRRQLSTSGIVFLVIAAAAPLTAMVGNLPIAIMRGNGAGLPGAFLLATLTLVCFSYGYAEIAKRVVNTGAFYTYVVLGLGKPLGVAAAFVAVLAYTVLAIALAAAFGFFGHLVASALGADVPWAVCAVVGIAITAFMGYRSIDLSSKLLAVLLVLEMAVIVWFDAAVVLERGTLALPLTSFDPGTVLGPGFSIGLMFAYTCFIGFEAAALFGEESRDPVKSIPRATLISVFLIGAFYLITTWITIGAVGAAEVRAVAQDRGGEFLLSLIAQYAGPIAGQLAGLLLCTSILASFLALHNAATRYLFALAREKLLPTRLGEFNSRRYAPSNASAVVSVITLASIGLFLVSGRDPYLVVLPSLIGLATLGVILLQAIASIAIVVFFSKQPRRAVFSTLVAPAIGALGLTLAVVLVMLNFSLLTSVDDALFNRSPLLFPCVAASGFLFALWLRRHRKTIYAGIGAVELRTQGTPQSAGRITYTDRYCIVGAGPGGLIAARAFLLQGIPYDHYEKHTDVGGIWDMDNPGTPMYESAHFISSKYTSGFFGFPMPDAYPDYPNNRQILEYVRSFAERYDLKRRIRFGTAVDHAKPLGSNAAEGWQVTLLNGEIHHYKGIVCATGVTWHPNLPDYPGLQSYTGEVRHANTHRLASDLKGRRVLIVGCGNSGADIACDAARNAKAAWLSVRRGYRFVPKHIFGVPTDVFVGGGLAPPKGVVVPDDTSKLLDAVVGDLTRFGLPSPDHDALQSHPIMNTQVLHHLAHGDLTAKPDVRQFTPRGAVFADGTEEEFDLVLFATGYNYKIPFLDESLFEWVSGHPKLYLNIFHRQLRGLSVLGFVEFADAGYQRFDEMAQMVALDAYIEQSGQGLDTWLQMKASHVPNLRGKMTYIDSPRHANYVDAPTFRRTLAEIRAQFGWFDPTDATYRGLERQDSGDAGTIGLRRGPPKGEEEGEAEPIEVRPSVLSQRELG
jgi:cation diffusion facilitator CzcD-associated flavoprotein CzcO/amino acid transporter